jgi:hypothetical protein
MANPSWLDDVQKRLFRQGLPPSYVERFVDELADHLEDLKERKMDTEADVNLRLGEPEQVANSAVAAYRRRSFLGRHPTAALLVFGISPLLSFIVLFLGFFAVLVLAEQRFDFGVFDDQHFGPLALTAFSYVFNLVWVVIPSVLACLLYYELAQWLGLGRKWLFLSCLVLTAVAALYGFRVDTFDSGKRSGVMDDIGFFGLTQLGRAMAPLAVGLWFLLRKRRRGYPAATFVAFAILPVVSLIALIGVGAIGLSLIFNSPAFNKFCEEWFGTPDGGLGQLTAEVLLFLAVLAVAVLPGGLLSTLFCQLAKRFDAGRKWGWTACAALAIMAVLPGYYVPIGSGQNGQWMCHIQQLCEFIVPLAIGWWFIRRTRDQGQLQLAL